MNDEEYITVEYPTISVIEKRTIMELCSSTLVNAFKLDDYLAILAVFQCVVDRLEDRMMDKYIEELQVDIAPIVHGEWIGVEGDGYAEDEHGEMQIVYDVFECSICGCEHHADGEPEWMYCPDCGARMDGKR